MNRIATGFLAVSLVVGGAACKKTEEAAKPAAEAAKPAAEPAKPAAEPAKPAGKMVTKSFDDLKQVSMEVPEDFSMISAVTGDFVQVGNDDFNVSVAVAGPAANETLAEAKEEAEKDVTCDFVSFVKAEETADGWVIHWKCKGPDSKEGHKVDVRRKIGDKSYECGWDWMEKAEAAEATIKVCQSVKAAS